MEPKENTFIIKALDCNDQEFQPGDQVTFIMRGWFLPREQETSGIVQSIDHRGGVFIEVPEGYRRFTSLGRPVQKEKIIYFTHFQYCSNSRTRKYQKTDGNHVLYICRVDPLIKNS